MRGYLIPVMGVCFAVDGLLLSGTGRLTGRPPDWGAIGLAAGLGAVYAGACLLPQLQFLSGTLWRLVSLAVMGVVAFGFDGKGLRSSGIFVVLNMAVGGLALALGGQGTVLLAAVIVCALCFLGLRGRPGGGECVPVVLEYEGRREQVVALRDTGNTLRDPVTGRSVLVVNAQTARSLLGLTRRQLAAPVETMTQLRLPGLRLVPYSAVGGSGFLLAIRLENVQIGNRKSSCLVAFAPAGLDGRESFQALTGGMV